MRKILLTSLALAVAAAPAVAHRGGDAPTDQKRGPKHERVQPGPKHERPDKGTKARGPKGRHHLVHACVVSDATMDSVELKVLGGNRHMRRALDGEAKGAMFTAKLDTETAVTGWTTRIRLVGRARYQLPEGSDLKRLPKMGTYEDLDQGDRVIVRFRAPRGTKAADLPEAFKVIDRGPAKKCAPEAPEQKTPEQETPETPEAPQL